MQTSTNKRTQEEESQRQEWEGSHQKCSNSIFFATNGENPEHIEIRVAKCLLPK